MDFLFDAVPTDPVQPKHWSPALDVAATTVELKGEDEILPYEPTVDSVTSMTACEGENCLPAG